MEKKRNNADQLAIWLIDAGYQKDLSPLVAGLLDMQSGIEEIQNRILPALLVLNPDQKDEILELLIDFWIKSEHLARHSEDLRKITNEIREFFDVTRTS